MTRYMDSDLMASPNSASSDCVQTLVLMRQQGANRFHPVDFYYMEALARRLDSQTSAVQCILQAKLALAVAAYQARHAQVQAAAADNAAHPAAPTRCGAQNPLGQLVCDMAQANPHFESTALTSPRGARTELKSVRNFRNTWSKLSALKQVSKALEQAPKNAGPINSHMLVLRSLELMRNISPDYLNRFMSYADTLLCLDQTDLTTKAAQVKPLASAKPRTRTRARP